MCQISTNLLSNSLKFTQKGYVSLDVSSIPDISSQALNVQFVMKDTGIGISKKAIDKLFKPFSQANTSTARIYCGTGLGLTICRDLTRLLGGEISLESTPGEATTVTCHIPFDLQRPVEDARRPSIQLAHRLGTGELGEIATTPQLATLDPSGARRSSTDIAETTSPSSLTTRHKLLVLIVDDNPINRKINSLFMKIFGHDVALVCDGQEACDYLSMASGNPRPAMVFMDCMMPIVDGYEATRKIRNDTEMFDEQNTRTFYRCTYSKRTAKR